MKLSTCTRAPARVLFATALALGLFASHAAAQEAQAAAPLATTTLDVCVHEGTGKWRYSGVVTVLGADNAGVAVDNRVQNQTSRAGYRSVLGAKSARGPGAAAAGEALVLPYVLEGAPLSLGVLRSETQVRLNGQGGARTLLAQSEPVTADTVTPCTPKGCVRTQGYWGNKPGVVWPKGYSRTAPFFDSGLTWQQILDTPPRGSAYLILAKQYIAAVLNRASGASAPTGVQSVITAATNWFRSGTKPTSCGPGQCAQQKAWAATLDAYNNGTYPGGPQHCK